MNDADMDRREVIREMSELKRSLEEETARADAAERALEEERRHRRIAQAFQEPFPPRNPDGSVNHRQIPGPEQIHALGERAHAWASYVYGADMTGHRAERAARIVEEALELAQAEGLTPEIAHRLVGRVYSRPVGEPHLEAGGLGVCLLVYGKTAGIDVVESIRQEVSRIEGLSATPEGLDELRRKCAAKVSAGVTAWVPTIEAKPSEVVEVDHGRWTVKK